MTIRINELINKAIEEQLEKGGLEPIVVRMNGKTMLHFVEQEPSFVSLSQEEKEDVVLTSIKGYSVKIDETLKDGFVTCEPKNDVSLTIENI